VRPYYLIENCSICNISRIRKAHISLKNACISPSRGANGGKSQYIPNPKIGNITSAGHIPRFIFTIHGLSFVYTEYFSELYDEGVHMHNYSNQWHPRH